MKDAEVFAGKQLTELLRDIYDHSATKRAQIRDIIHDLRQHLNKAEDAVVFAPIIKDYLDIMIKNDDSLVKVATIVQRIISAETKGGGDDLGELLTDDEKHKLFQLAHTELDAALAKVNDTVKALPPSFVSTLPAASASVEP